MNEGEGSRKDMDAFLLVKGLIPAEGLPRERRSMEQMGCFFCEDVRYVVLMNRKMNLCCSLLVQKR